MSNNLIKFHSCHPSNINNEYKPAVVKNNIPQWYFNKDKFKIDHHGQKKFPTWKSCPALLDVFLSGYYLFTPCDINIIDSPHACDIHGEISFEYSDDWKKIGSGKPICNFRGVEEGLPSPEGYYEHSFIWYPNWFSEVPKGYTVLVIHPMNTPNLPFQTMSGFIDSGSPMVGSGNIPFYIKKGFRGIIPAGTPYAQLIPIKNESWESEIIEYTDEEMKEYWDKKIKEYVVGHGLTKYKELDWLKKHYE